MNTNTNESARLLSERLLIARLAVGHTQVSAGASAGISAKSVQAYELGTQIPSAEALRRLAVAYRVRSDWLLGLCEQGGPRKPRTAKA